MTAISIIDDDNPNHNNKRRPLSLFNMTTTATMPATSPSAVPTPMASTSSSSQTSSGASLSTPIHALQNSLPRPLSYASKNRMLQYPTTPSVASRSRPSSHVFPMFPSTLPYAQVRDFAYPVMHPLHYGPPPEPSGPPSGLNTPGIERRLSDPPVSWDQKMPWDSWSADGFNRGHDLPPIRFGDGPPYSEDEDLQSPVVSTRHRKQKSSSSAFHTPRQRGAREREGHGAHVINPSSSDDDEGGYFLGTGRSGGERFYMNHGGGTDGPSGEFVTFPSDQARINQTHAYAQPMSDHDGYRSGSDGSSCSSSPEFQEKDQSRYSRDYQFTITSPDEEFHGKAVALFDFERENENELPLVEGQIIWVSYRHGQGWLVAEDPKTQESGLVPEEYVRLLRDIEGGMSSLTGEGAASPGEEGTPVQQESSVQSGHTPTSSISMNGYHQPVVSVFSTSSKDLNPYPTEQLGLQSRQSPPQVVHYHGQRGGSQTSAQIPAQFLAEASVKHEEGQDAGNKEPEITLETTQGEKDIAKSEVDNSQGAQSTSADR